MLRGDPDETARLLEGDVERPARESGPRGETRRLPSQAEYEAGVVRCKEYIRAGDAFQIVLSQRAERPTTVSALALYRSLRQVNPSPYLFLLELDGLALVGSSPETLVKCEGTRASVNPIAGSTQPGEGDAERLLASEKDRAEHVMLVDLGRNDLSRVCRAGTVKVERFLEAERFSHITHLVSEVAGEIAGGRTHFDVLRATLPGRDGLRGPEGARDADHLGARGLPARARTRAPCCTRCRAGRSTRASRSGRSSCTSGWRCSRRAPASSPTPIRAPSTRSACASSPRSRPRSTWRRRG